MEKNKIIEYALKAYDEVYNNSEDVIVREAISRYSDSEDVTDYVESYQNIFKEGWVNFVAFRGAFKSYLDDEENLTCSDMEEQLVEDFQIAQITNVKIGTTYKYIRPKEVHEGDSVPSEQNQASAFPELSEQEKKDIVDKIKNSASPYEGHWISMVDLGASLKAAQIDYKTLGFPKLRDLLAQLLDYIEIRVDSPVKIFVHVKGDEASNDIKVIKPIAQNPSNHEAIVTEAIK